MKNVTQKLEELGLSRKEISVYVEGVSSGPLSVQALAKRTGIKRPTVYHTVNQLAEKGLANTRDTYNGKRIVMTSPRDLYSLIDAKRHELDRQEQAIEEVVPYLETLFRSASAKLIQTQHFEGIESVKVAIDEALYCKGRMWDIIAPRKNFFDDFSEEYKEYYIKTRKSRKITNRTLWESREQKDLDGKEDFAWRNPRILPEVMSDQFAQIMVLFDDKVLYLSSYKNLSAVIMTSQEHHDFMKALFEGLWHGATPVQLKSK